VTQVDPLLKTITVNASPAGTIAGDALVINISQGAGGANPVSLEGLLYNHVDSSSGSWNNLARSTYPEVLKTPHVAAGRRDHHACSSQTGREQAAPRAGRGL
jgi:hypothetical protein